MRTAPTPIVIGFAEVGNKNPIPVPSQIGVIAGAASYSDGFPPLTMTPLVEGGVPPAGLDMNGILFMVSNYCAWLQSGGQFQYSATFVTQNTGYQVGAILQSATDPARFYLNALADNAANPDSDLTGWIPYSPVAAPTGVQAGNVAAGAQVVALAAGAGFVDLTPNAGATTVTNFTGGVDGQIIVVTNMHASNALTIQANANIRMSGDLTLLENNSTSLRYSAALALWVAMNG